MSDDIKSSVSGTLHSELYPKKRVVNISEEKAYIGGWSVHELSGLHGQPSEKHEIQSGDLLTIFNTVSDGDVLWDGKIKLEYDRNKEKFPSGYEQQQVHGMWVHGLQEDLPPDEWGEMFLKEYPARLEKKDGTVLFGHLEAFFETGTEGVLWAVYEYKDTENPYERLHILEDGDQLTVYGAVRNGDIAWQGEVDLEPANDQKDWIPLKEKQKDVDADEWRYLAGAGMPAVLTRKP